VYFLLLIAAIGMGIWLYSRYALLILSAVYVAHGVVWYLLGMLRPRRDPQAEAARG
jgi:hypothetical protein